MTQTNVALTWTAATDDTGILSYRLYNGNNLIATVPGSVHSFQVSALTPGTDYTFKLEAVDAWGNPSNPGASTTVKTSSLGTGAANWQQYWPLIIAAGVAVAALASIAVLRRRMRLRDQARATQGSGVIN